MKRFAATAVFLLLTGVAFAADVDGKWTGTMTTPNGDVPVGFTFSDVIAAFDKPGGMPITLNYKGVVAKDQIKFTIDVFGMPLELLVKRAS